MADQINSWIPVEERLPERLEDTGTWVIVQPKFVPENAYAIPQVAEFQADGTWRVQYLKGPFEETCGLKVTHWMPLPKKPT